MSLSILLFAAKLVAPASAGSDPPSPAAEEGVPTRGTSPLEGPSAHRRPERGSPLPPDGVGPLEGASPAHAREPASSLPPDGAAPLDDVAPASGDPPTFALPLGMGPAPETPEPLDPTTVRLVRVDAMAGAMWRIYQADPIVSTSVEFGQMHGFSGAFHTEMMVVTDRDFVRALDVPIGVGAIARGRLGHRPLYGSIGLTAGILVHRAGRDEGVIHRVDPDFRVPIRLAWTVGKIGASLALVTGYSVRDRIYERRGSYVLERHAIRVGFMVGLHWDLTVGRGVVVRRRDR